MNTSSNQVLIDYTPVTHTQKLQQSLHKAPKQFQNYVSKLCPIIHWIHRYNLSWLFQDAIAGVTVGMLIVPQGIAYAKIANLDPQYGLYTSFVGVALYCFFGTSKDISIGPITVISLLVGQAITKVTHAHPDISGPEVAICLSLFCGIITSLIGLCRLGILVDFISEPAIAGYMTGSALTISLGQWPKVFGLHVSSRQPPYLIIYNFFKHLNETQLDAAFGLTALVALYVIKIGGSRLAQRMPARMKQALFFVGIMRSGLVVIAGTFVSFLVNRNHRETPLISIIEEVPAGFDAMGVPSLNWTVFKEASSVMPSIILIMILEHVSVAKSFGRLSNYVVDPNQEILAIGMSNIVGSFFGAYPCTGAFSRTAVMSRSGAKTPMAGIFSGAVVVMALYVLTPAFFYIPEAVLGAVVIHAVVDLVSGPSFLYKLWKSSILETMIFVLAVVVTIFMDVETAIYISVGLSLLLMLLRLARPSISILGRVKLASSSSKHITTSSSSTSSTARDDIYGNENARYIYVDESDVHFNHLLDPLPEGILAIRLNHAILYPNANYIAECITHIVKSRTRPLANCSTVEAVWNQPSSKEIQRQDHHVPHLQALVLDFSGVNQLDATAIHTLHATREALDRYVGSPVDWHFCQLVNPQVRQALLDAGFGDATGFSVPLGISVHKDAIYNSAASMPTLNSLRDPMDDAVIMASTAYDHEYTSSSEPLKYNDMVLLPEDKYPAFHWDIESAVYAITSNSGSNKKNNASSITVTVY